MVYAQLDEEKLKNERLSQRVRESKTKTQILAYSQLDSSEYTQKQLQTVTSKLANATTLIEQMTALIQEKDSQLEMAHNSNRTLQQTVDSLGTQLKQRELYMNDLRATHEIEISERDQRLRLA